MSISTISISDEALTVLSHGERIAIKKGKEFCGTNFIWNKYNFNSRNNIGSLMELINECEPKNFSEWEDFYFENFNPERDFNGVFKKFAVAAGISEELAYTYTYIRVIDETYIGYKRELKAFEDLSEYCKTQTRKGKIVTCRHTEVDVDINYAIDVEVLINGKIVAGIQLKSQRYINNHFVRKSNVGHMNAKKHRAYTKKYGAHSFYLTYQNIANKSFQMIPSA